MDLKKLKNDKERIAFLEDYRNLDNGWKLLRDDKMLNRRMWEYVLPDCSLIVEEQLQTIMWPTKHASWNVMHWYILEDPTLPFADGCASRTQALAKLKEVMKK